MERLEVVIVWEFYAAREEFNGCHARAALGHVIVPKIDQMDEGHGPEVESSFTEPVNYGMEHHVVSP
jgi:hypothetical protein